MNRHFSLHQILFFCFTILVSLPAITLVIWLERSSVAASVDGAEDKHLVLARSISLAISRYLRDVESIVNFMRGEEAHEKTGLMADANIHFIVRLNDDLSIKQKLATDGRIVYQSLSSALRADLSASFAAAREKPGAPVLSPAIFNETREPAIYVITAESDGGLTMAEVNTSYLVELQKSFKFGRGGHGPPSSMAGATFWRTRPPVGAPRSGISPPSSRSSA